MTVEPTYEDVFGKPDPISTHVAMVHRLAESCGGKLIVASYGENSETGEKITSKVRSFQIGDVDGMAAAVRELAGEKHRNVYAPLCVMRGDLPDRDKGSEADIVAVLGIVGDFDDADAAHYASRSPSAPNYVMETSPGRYQTCFLFAGPLPMAEAKALGERLALHAGCDYGTKDMSHVWRVPGTPNWPSKKKLAQGRSPEPQQVRVVQPWSGGLTDPADLDRVLPPLPVTPAADITQNAEPIELDSLSEDLRRVIVDGVPQGERSDKFHWAVAELKERGADVDAIYSLLAKHPEGIAAKFINRLRSEIARCYAKATGRPTPQEEFSVVGGPLMFTVKQWLARELAEPDFLLGNLFSTTSRAMLVGPTGAGKTNFAFAVNFSMAGSRDFLHWRAHRPARRILYFDGEMSARLARERLREAVQRHGDTPENLIVINRDDFPDLPPLDTKEGQQYVNRLIEQAGGVDFVTFDNVQSLVSGSMVDEEAWAFVLPWARDLTRRSIGQWWAHHTGHDATRSYGTKTREWQLDTVMLMKARGGENGLLIDFDLEFTKARERSPRNRSDFATARIWIGEDDRWHSSIVPVGAPKKQTSPMAGKFLQALSTAMSAHGVTGGPFAGAPKAVTRTQWKEAAMHVGLIDKDAAPNQQRAKLYKYQVELIEAEILAVQDDWVWRKGDVFQAPGDVFGTVAQGGEQPCEQPSGSGG